MTNATFARLFDELLERYNFTVTEDTPLDVEVAVDPEMLGRIFERLVTGRHQTGSYYTPRNIVSFMCREALKHYLGASEGVDQFVDEHDAAEIRDPEEALNRLREMKVCDPACGSGAYLVGMLQELMALRHALFASHSTDPRTDFERKLDIIQNCIYGVDIDPVAVNIARLRLWLTLSIELDDPQPLPNLDFKIERGDSILCPRIKGEASLNDEQVRQFAELKAQYLKENYNKGSIRKKINELRVELGRWIIHDQATGEGDFDWRVDFAEVLSTSETPGFDVILANPPYVHAGLIRPMKKRLKELYPEVYSGTADLYTYFYARGLELLKKRGMLVFICSSTWTKTAAAKKLRAFLGEHTTIRRFLDFGDLPVFENVTAYPAIVSAEKAPPADDHVIQANLVKSIRPVELDSELSAPGVMVPQGNLSESGWRFEDRRLARLRDKIANSGSSLKDCCGSPLYGVKTGLNEAFVVDQRTRDALVAADPGCAEALKPFLKGKDLKTWRADWQGLWLIRIPSGWTNQHAGRALRSEREAWSHLKGVYPSVAEWLSGFAEKARKRCDKGDWYWELRPCVYYDAFERPKVIYPHFCSYPCALFDTKDFYVVNKGYVIPDTREEIAAILNSSVAWFWITGICTPKAGGFYELCTQFMETVPIPSFPPAEGKKIVSLCANLSSEKCRNRDDKVAELNDRVATLYGLSREERRIIENSGAEAT